MAVSTIVVKAIVQADDGRILLLRRSKDDDIRPGDWDFPGGGVDAGEDVVAAIIRELHEEVGLAVQLSDVRLIFAHTELKNPKISVTRLIFTVPVKAPNITLSHEHQEHKWVDLEHAIQNFNHPIYNQAMRYAEENQLIVSKNKESES